MKFLSLTNSSRVTGNPQRSISSVPLDCVVIMRCQTGWTGRIHLLHLAESSQTVRRKKILLLKKRAGPWPRCKHDVLPSRRPMLLPGLKDLLWYPAGTKHQGTAAGRLWKKCHQPLCCVTTAVTRGPWSMSHLSEAEEAVHAEERARPGPVMKL